MNQNSMLFKADTILINCNIATMADDNLSIIRNGAICVTGKIISWVGNKSDLKDDFIQRCKNIIDCNNQFILPGFVDCHTHLVYGGSRSNEFEMRLKGASYEEIAKSGGGISSTVNATRKASMQELYNIAIKREETLLHQGVTTIEIKSGYGLDLKTEIKMLEVIKQLNDHFPLHIAATFLGAHTVPKEFKQNSDGYIDLVTNTMLPEIKKRELATSVDIFCETIGFSIEQTKKCFKKQKS